MDTSHLLLELSDAWHTRYLQFSQEKKHPIKLRYPLSLYIRALHKLKKKMKKLSFEDVKLILFLFATVTHRKSQENLWDVARFFHRHPSHLANFMRHLFSPVLYLYQDNWVLLQGNWPSENQMSEFFSLSDYFSTIYNQTLSLNVIGYSRLLSYLFPGGQKNTLPFSLKKHEYATLSEFLQDIQTFFSTLKFYKTVMNETISTPPTIPWFNAPPFASMIDTIRANLKITEEDSAQFPMIIAFLYLLQCEGKSRFYSVFFFYLIYLVFIRQETQQSIEHTFQMLSITQEEVWGILSFFNKNSAFIEKNLIHLVSKDFFGEEEEENETDTKEKFPILTSKNFEVSKEKFYEFFAFFHAKKRALKKTRTNLSMDTSDAGIDQEDLQDLDTPYSSDDMLSLMDDLSPTEESQPIENTTSIITVEKKETLYEIMKPNITLSKIILDDEVKQELLDAVDMTKTMKVLKKWGVKPSLSQKEASSIKILLHGVSGTGKTITAQALAGEANAKLFKVDAANLVSSFVGESTRNVKRVFEEYYNYVKNSKDNVFFFINEADQLLSSRGTIQQAADKEYNQMQNLLLEEIENFRGVFIATTNLIELFDVAWNRRFNIKIRFEIPKYETRLKLWQVHVSEKIPLSSDVDMKRLAEYELAGGSIANVVYNAARKAASRTGNEQIIVQKDFLDAVDKELKSVLGTSSKKVGFNR